MRAAGLRSSLPWLLALVNAVTITTDIPPQEMPHAGIPRYNQEFLGFFSEFLGMTRKMSGIFSEFLGTPWSFLGISWIFSVGIPRND